MGLAEWDALVQKYFAAREYEVFVPQRGFAERAMKFAAGSEWRAARWLGGTLAAVCRKSGSAPERTAAGVVRDQATRTAAGVVRNEVTLRSFDRFEQFLRCPDCHAALERGEDDALECLGCGYRAVNQGEVYNLLPSRERNELYPGERDDIIDFSLPSHARQLLEGWYELEGVFGNKYRWIGARAAAKLRRVASGPQRLRIRGHASPEGVPGEVRARVNGSAAGAWKLDRPGLFVLEADVPESSEYLVEIEASPTWTVPTDDRVLSVNLSMIRLVSR
jgi:hypothetical protein